MINQILSSYEKNILDTRGFYVKKLPFSVQSFVIDSFILLFAFCLSLVFGQTIWYIFNILDFSTIFAGWVTGILIAKWVHNYITNNRVYFLKDQILWNGYLQNSREGSTTFIQEHWYIFSDLPRHFPVLRWSPILNKFPALMEWTPGKNDESGKIIFLVLLLASSILVPLTLAFPSIAIITLISIVVPVILRYFNSIFRFWTYATSLQKLTGTFLSNVNEIKMSFTWDMNFSLLKKNFIQFSHVFSHIFSLLSRLERLESNIYKWDFFDTHKYICSLRSDILEPLKQLKTFLEKQRDELLHLQKELQRIKVQVGADPSFHSGWGEQAELSSSRSEPLMAELTENIEKLDEMIRKMSNR